jgi:hypothetical protein
MLDFSEVKAVSIPEGAVKSFGVGPTVLWSAVTEVDPATVNRLPLATATVGGAEIYNGIGYATSTRLSSSGEAKGGVSNMCATGFISCKPGDTLRVENVDHSSSSACYIISYNSAGTKLVHKQINGTDGKNLGIYNNVTADQSYDLVLTSATFGDFAAVRISEARIDSTTNIYIRS